MFRRSQPISCLLQLCCICTVRCDLFSFDGKLCIEGRQNLSRFPTYRLAHLIFLFLNRYTGLGNPHWCFPTGELLSSFKPFQGVFFLPRIRVRPQPGVEVLSAQCSVLRSLMFGVPFSRVVVRSPKRNHGFNLEIFYSFPLLSLPI